MAAEAVGIEVVGATDLSKEALEVLSSATGVPTVAGDIGALLRDDATLREWARSSPDLILGGPPCTAFSHAGFWLDYKREGKDEAASGIERFVDAVEKLGPAAFVMENVPGLLFKTHREALDATIKRMKGLGYAVATRVLKASDFSVAQARRRLFIVGTRGRRPVDLTGWPAFPSRNVEWAFTELPASNVPEVDEVPSGKYLELLAAVPPGGNYLVHTKERGSPAPAFKYRGRYWSFLLKLDPNKPASTLPAQRVTWNGPFHWDNRHLRVREMARLQAFPDSVRFSDDLQTARRQIGNAVPVLLGAAVLDRVRAALSGDARTAPVLDAARDPSATWREVSRPVEEALARARARHLGGAAWNARRNPGPFPPGPPHRGVDTPGCPPPT